ncbi:MAG: type IV pilus assembly protein PilM [Candidatus Abyssubacteria bacterium]|nr:type IV pilus assembly protein PilM [Candidatus Abyssubacteria bacterium]
MASRNEYSPIGLDLGDTSIKIVQLRSKRDREWRLHAAAKSGYSALEPAGSGDADTSALKKTIRRMLRNGKFVGRKVATVLPRTDVLVRPVKLPAELKHAGPEEIWEALRAEARRYLPYPVEEAVLDFLSIDNAGSEEEEKPEVLLISAHEKKANQYLSLLKSLGLQCLCIDIVPCAVVRTAGQIIGNDCDDTVVVVEIGERTSFVGMSRAKKLLFSRCFNRGSAMLTDAIAEELGLAPEKAEMFKHEYGIDHRANVKAELWDDVRLSPSAAPGVIFDVCRAELENFAYEMKRSIDYFLTQFKMIKVEKAVLFGGGAELKGLSEYLADETKLEVRVGDPFASLPSDNGAIDDAVASATPSFAVALGLALRGDNEEWNT